MSSVLADRTTVSAGKRYAVKAGAGAPVTGDAGSTIHRLPQGTTVLAAEVDPAGDRVRISSPAGWMNADDLAPAEPATVLTLPFDIFLERHTAPAPGDFYKLEFPFTLDGLRAAGAEFLTTAFRVAGTISADNSVTEIVALEPLTLMGASANAFLTVAYAKPEPGLRTELFVKVPPGEAGYKYPLSVMSHGEVAMLRFGRKATLPINMAQYYYGDYCTYSTNYILITERIGFGVPPIEPAWRKGYNREIPQIEDHYRALTKALARLVAAHKTGALGHDIEDIFPFARAARNFPVREPPDAKIDRLVDFVGRVAPQLFVAEATGPAFLRQWREDLRFGLAHKDTLVAYLHEKVDYTGLCHPNLNPDNAWFWRDPSGELQVGLIDWGGAGQMSIAQSLTGMLMMPEPELYLTLVHDVIATFIAEYAANGGLALDPDELLFQFQASVFSTAISTIITVIVDLLFQFSEDEYRSMKDRFDDRLVNGGLYAAIIWIDNMLRGWLEPLTPGDAARRIVARGG